MNITVSAPGKVILSGEHAVVYGYPALLSAVNRRLTFSLPLQKTDYPKDIWELEKRVRDIGVKSGIPLGSGMGSSAAYAVAVAAMWLKLQGISTKKKINELAYNIEKKHHGNPSGADNTISTYGGYLWYRKETESLKTFQRLKVPTNTPSFYLINSGKPEETTKEMVDFIGERIKDRSRVIKDIFLQIEKIVRHWAQSLEKDLPFNLIKEMIRDNQRLLVQLGVVSPVAQHMVSEVEKIDGAAKITGAGGRLKGSGMLLVVHQDVEKLKLLVSTKRWDMLAITLGEKGVIIS